MRTLVLIAVFVGLLFSCDSSRPVQSPPAGAPKEASEGVLTETVAARAAEERPARRPSHPIPKANSERRPFTGQAFSPAPPWRNEWCVSHDTAWSKELQKKHIPPGSDFKLETRGFSVNCGWSTTGGALRLGIAAGLKFPNYGTMDRSKARSQLGISKPVLIDAYDDKTGVQVWSDTPPYHLFIWASELPEPERKRRAIALAKDMVEHLTVERLSKPMAEIVVVDRAKDGKAARRDLEEWPWLRAAFEHVAPLAPGFPRLAKGSEFRGDPGKSPEPDEEFLLLGVCQSGAGQLLANLGMHLWLNSKGDTDQEANPNRRKVEHLVVESDDLTVECPRVMEENQSLSPGAGWKLPGGRLLSLGVTESPDEDSIGLHGAAILWRDGQVLDLSLFEMERPAELKDVQGRYQAYANRRRAGKCDMTHGYSTEPGNVSMPHETWLRYACPVEWTDLHCRTSPEHQAETIEFRVAEDDRIEFERKEEQFPGRGCVAPE